MTGCVLLSSEHGLSEKHEQRHFLIRYFFSAFLIAGLLNFICSVLVLRGRPDADSHSGFFEMRWQVHKHLKSYRKYAQTRSGRTPWSHYGYQISLAATIGFFLLTLLSIEQIN
jgi:hypothetical protein